MHSQCSMTSWAFETHEDSKGDGSPGGNDIPWQWQDILFTIEDSWLSSRRRCCSLAALVARLRWTGPGSRTWELLASWCSNLTLSKDRWWPNRSYLRRERTGVRIRIRIRDTEHGSCLYYELLLLCFLMIFWWLSFSSTLVSVGEMACGVAVAG